MIAPTTRRLCAWAMPRGLSEGSADEVQRTFESSGASAPPRAIERIVQHAVRNVPFYRRQDPLPFESLPVIEKSMMVTEPGAFFADGARPERLTSRMSSGSSGIPFTSYSDGRRIARHRAGLVAGYRYLGADPFGPFVHCRPWFQASRRERLSYALRGQYLYSGEQDKASIHTLARWISRHRGTTVIGLCSFVETLLRSFEAFGIAVPAGSVGVVLGVGEPASRYLAAASPRLFGVDLSRRYSNSENGILGLARSAATHFHLDTSTFHIEILDQDSDVPAAPGTPGRIVVTDLYNRAMPFIRYNTGDLGCLALDDSGRPVPNVLAELVGRRSDIPIAGTEEAPVRATYFKLFMRVDSQEEIRQFQLRQHAIGRFTWVLNADPSPALESRIRQLLDEEVGDILSCEFRYVTDVPLAQSGKTRFFVNEMHDADTLLFSAAD